MTIRRVLGAAAVTCGLLLLSAPAFAHHSFAAEFDGKNCRDFSGTLTKLDWQSPHAYFYLDVKDPGGKVNNWSFQTYALITLRRNGTERQMFIESGAATHDHRGDQQPQPVIHLRAERHLHRHRAAGDRRRNPHRHGPVHHRRHQRRWCGDA